MNQRSVILTAIREYLQGRGYKTSLFFSARIADPPMVLGPPCISIAVSDPSFPNPRIVALRLVNDIIMVYSYTRSMQQAQTAIEINDPRLFDIIESFCVDPTARDNP